MRGLKMAPRSSPDVVLLPCFCSSERASDYHPIAFTLFEHHLETRWMAADLPHRECKSIIIVTLVSIPLRNDERYKSVNNFIRWHGVTRHVALQQIGFSAVLSPWLSGPTAKLILLSCLHHSTSLLRTKRMLEGPRLTEERLRHHLDSNQPARERMCLAGWAWRPPPRRSPIARSRCAPPGCDRGWSRHRHAATPASG